MNTKHVVLTGLLFVLFIYSETAKAQFQLTNNLTCKVVVTYEMWDPSCDVCQFATISINAGQTITLTNCTFSDICVIVKEVGGTSITWYNHANSGAFCHPPLGTTGQSSTGECTGGRSSIQSAVSRIFEPLNNLEPF